MTTFFFSEQKPEMEIYRQFDENFGNTDGRPPDTIYHDSLHPAYLARWNAALALRNMANQIDPIDSEVKWSGLMAGFVFQDINNHASE